MGPFMEISLQDDPQEVVFSHHPVHQEEHYTSRVMYPCVVHVLRGPSKCILVPSGDDLDPHIAMMIWMEPFGAFWSHQRPF